MSHATTYLKCACGHCAGHIEFPVEAAGATIHCPHCEAPTTLMAESQPSRRPFNVSSRRIRKRIVLPGAFALLASAAFLIVIARPRSLLVRDLHFEHASSNNAGEITGVVENKSSRLRRGVRVEIDLLNSRGETLWRSTDYTPELAAKGAWRFRALVLDPNVATGKIAQVTAD